MVTIKKLCIVLLLSGCWLTPGHQNYTPVVSENHPIIIINDSIVTDSHLSLTPLQEVESVPTQTSTSEYGKNNWKFYTIFFIVSLCAVFYWLKRRENY